MGVYKTSKYVELVYTTVIYHSDSYRCVQKVLFSHICIYIFFIYKYVLVSRTRNYRRTRYRIFEL